MKPERYTVQARVSEQERSRFERAAIDAGLSLSDWVRFSLRAAAGMWVGQEGRMMAKSVTIRVSAKQYEDDDDCLSAAAADFVNDRPEAKGYDLCARWDGGDDGGREYILLDVPRHSLDRPGCREYELA